jgi:hypothetical protein
MQRVPLQSSTLASALYDPHQRLLELEFRNGESYLYFRVPPHCYLELLQADSKGAYFNHNIRNHFPYQHCSPHPPPVVLAPKTK